MLSPSRTVEVVASVIAVLALAAIVAVQYRPSPRPDRSLHRQIGQSLAKEALAIVRPNAAVTVISRDTESFRQPALDILAQSLERELRRGGAPPPRWHLLQTDPLRPVDVPSGDFFELLRRSSADDVIVSLFGPPLLTAAQRARLPAARARVVAFCPGTLGEVLDLGQLFQARLLEVAVVTRRPPAQAEGASEFEQLYRIVRAADHVETSASFGAAGRDDP